jgi:hypothetical protein
MRIFILFDINSNVLRRQLSTGALEYFNQTRTYDDWNRDIDSFIKQLQTT